MLLFLFIAGCSKSNNTNKIDNQIDIDDHTYIITATSFFSDEEIYLTIKTSLEPEKKITIERDTTKKIYVRAAAGEYVQFTVSKIPYNYRVTDSKGILIADYTSLPASTNNTTVLDFIAFAPNDIKKDLLQYKMGLVKSAADNLMSRDYLLKKRYFVENGIQTDNSGIQPACSYNDAYQFIPYPGELGNFNPERLLFTTVIDKNLSSCTYGDFGIIPTNDLSIISNNSNTFNFPIWDPASIDGGDSSMIYRQFFIDSLSSIGVFTMHRNITDIKKEVFVYEPK